MAPQQVRSAPGELWAAQIYPQALLKKKFFFLNQHSCFFELKLLPPKGSFSPPPSQALALMLPGPLRASDAFMILVIVSWVQILSLAMARIPHGQWLTPWGGLRNPKITAPRVAMWLTEKDPREPLVKRSPKQVLGECSLSRRAFAE